MVLIESIVLDNCRLCHNKPGLYEINPDKKLIRDIYECVKVKVNDRLMDLLPRSVCEECKKTIKCFSLYKQHIRKVDQCLRRILKHSESNSEETFVCNSCPGTFSSEDIFKKHLNSHSLNATLKEENLKVDISCPSCKENFKNVEDYGSHDCGTNKSKSLQKMALKYQTNLKEEIKDNSELPKESTPNEYCSTPELGCEEKCKKQDLTVQNKAKYVCSWKNCKKILNSAYSLKTHELKHEGKRSFLCVTCGKGFITKNSLTCHEKIHLDVKGYTCKLCNIGFSVRSNLRAHEKKHHEGVRFYCSQCTKAFSSKCSLERHERIHTGIKEFQCESCPSAFYTNKELLKHQRYHQGLRLHKCDECFKTFFERHHLIIHLRSHTGERPYVCKVPNCGKSFMESQKLKRHHNAKHAQT